MVTQPRRKLIYEGKAKIIFEGPEPGTLVQHFKDDVTGDNGKAGTVIGKGVLNNRISELIMQRLGEMGIVTHFIKTLNMREQLIKRATVLPLAIVVRNVVAGNLAERLGLEEGIVLPRAIIEFFLKHNSLPDPLVTEEHIHTFGWADPFELEEIKKIALRVNDYLSGFFMAVGIRLIDIRLEFGRLQEDDYEMLVIADEISPDCCRLWDVKTNEKLDKDRFLLDLGGVAEAYQDVAKRLGVLDKSLALA